MQLVKRKGKRSEKGRKPLKVQEVEPKGEEGVETEKDPPQKNKKGTISEASKVLAIERRLEKLRTYTKLRGCRRPGRRIGTTSTDTDW